AVARAGLPGRRGARRALTLSRGSGPAPVPVPVESARSAGHSRPERALVRALARRKRTAAVLPQMVGLPQRWTAD
ncbi:MAG TPA: hypothetical protein VLO00_10765, partial [Cryobacterium sp.]|nr:hypothetical protein [Cryobacterium sp.]